MLLVLLLWRYESAADGSMATKAGFTTAFVATLLGLLALPDEYLCVALLTPITTECLHCRRRV